MKRIIAIASFAIIVFPCATHAVGLGVYGTGGANFNTWESREGTYSSQDFLYGGGLVIDSNVAKNAIFNYRFTCGYSQYRIKDPQSGMIIDPFHRVGVGNIFGFGLLRTETVRFWLGPRIDAHYIFKRKTINDIEIAGYYIIPIKRTIKIDLININALLALGVNVNLGSLLTLFFDMGVGYMGVYNINQHENGHGFGLDGRLGVLFRINDRYTSE